MAHDTKFRICDFMTPTPLVIAPDLSLADARERMFRHDIRHLPVVKDGHLVGVVTQRDIAVVEATSPERAAEMCVGDAMNEDVFTCGPEARIDVIAGVMASERYGCVVVVGREKPTKCEGIFTAVDAMRALVYFSEPTLRSDATLPGACKPD